MQNIGYAKAPRDFDFPMTSIKCQRSVHREMHGVDFAQIKFFKAGGNAIVYTGKWNNKTIAIKMLKQKQINVRIAQHEIIMEANILTKANHPNIIEIFGCGEIPRKFVVVEYLEGGTLSQLLRKTIVVSTELRSDSFSNPSVHPMVTSVISKPISFSRAMVIATELASALKYLHEDMHPSATVIHRGAAWLLPYPYE